jgi:hypothetical protein
LETRAFEALQSLWPKGLQPLFFKISFCRLWERKQEKMEISLPAAAEIALRAGLMSCPFRPCSTYLAFSPVHLPTRETFAWASREKHAVTRNAVVKIRDFIRAPFTISMA